MYKIKYKLFTDTDTSEFTFKGEYSDLKDAIYQLGKGFGRFDEKLIKGFHVIEDFQVIEQNYDFESNGKHYILEELTTTEIEQGVEVFPICLEEEMHIAPIEEDITNRLFRECNVSLSSLMENEGMHLGKSNLYVNGIPFKIEEKTKLYELIHLLLTLRSLNGEDSIPYEKMPGYYLHNLFSELKKTDLEKEKIKNILKSKMELIRDSLGLKELPISAQKRDVVFRI